MKRVYCFLLVMCSVSLAAQEESTQVFQSMSQKEETYKKWVENLYEAGIRMDKDSIYITEEAGKAATDPAYRALLYPDTYTWPTVTALFNKMQYKIAFWYLINLYQKDPSSREFVLQYVLTLDEAFEMDKVLVSVFYTYGLVDPEIGMMVSGKPQINHPEKAEAKLAVVKELISLLQAHRQQTGHQG